jgi:hypothetical protein
MSGALPHSRSAISIASVISVVASEPHEYYRRHIIIGIDNSQVGMAASSAVQPAADVSLGRYCIACWHAFDARRFTRPQL